ncbi:uncharacterized protein LOC122557700 isoform X2 [Chiloscyllium plagiosum]|nr:uncharacterized protein LOC122557700 isoform X2 [Chiloscyllium plagiosum]
MSSQREMQKVADISCTGSAAETQLREEWRDRKVHWSHDQWILPEERLSLLWPWCCEGAGKLRGNRCASPVNKQLRLGTTNHPPCKQIMAGSPFRIWRKYSKPILYHPRSQQDALQTEDTLRHCRRTMPTAGAGPLNQKDGTGMPLQEWLQGDMGYPLQILLMTQLPKLLTDDKCRYNAIYSLTGAMVEQILDLLKVR